MVVLKRKQIVLVALIVMVAIAGYLNVMYNKTDGTLNANMENKKTEDLGEAKYVNGPVTKSNYFVDARMQRETVRSKALEILQKVVGDQNSSKEAKDTAQARIVGMAKATEQEGICENLIVAKGFSDVVVYITDGIVNITVKADNLSPQDAIRISDIITTQTGIKGNNIKIVEVK